MQGQTIPADQADAATLRKYAEVAFGLDIVPQTNRESIIAKLKAAGWPGETVRVFTSAPSGPVAPRKPGDPPAEAIFVQRRGGREREFICVYIHAGEGKAGQLPVPVMVNGRALAIPRETPSLIPAEFHGALCDAKVQIYTGGIDDAGRPKGLETAPRETASYPFTYRSAVEAVNYAAVSGAPVEAVA